MFDPTHYPRRYAAGWFAKTVWVILTLCALVAIVGTIHISPRVSPWPVAAGAMATAVMMAAWSVWTTAGKFQNWLVLYPDRLEYRDLRTFAVIHRSEIAETFGGGREDGRLEISLRLVSGRTVTIHSYAKGDSYFKEWFGSFPNVEYQEAIRREDAIRANPGFGVDPDRRPAAYRAWDRIVSIAAVLSGLAVFWAMLFPQPYALVVGYIVFVPVVAFCAAAIWRRKLTLTIDERAGRVSVGPLVSFPTVGLVYRGVMDANLVHPPEALPAIFAAAVVILLLGIVIDGRVTVAGAIAGLILSLGYSAGAGVTLNALLDRVPGQVHVTRVVENDTVGTTLRLKPDRWPGSPPPRYYTTSVSVFYSVRPGDRVCVHTRPGALGWAHIDLRTCPKGG
jgi:hypothetical protein